MHLNDYQKLAERTSGQYACTTDMLINACLGLSGETGEFNDIVKKFMFHSQSLPLDKLQLELGDILWYVAQAASAIGMNLDAVAASNLEKLQKRYPERAARSPEGFSSNDIRREEKDG